MALGGSLLHPGLAERKAEMQGPQNPGDAGDLAQGTKPSPGATEVHEQLLCTCWTNSITQGVAVEDVYCWGHLQGNAEEIRGKGEQAIRGSL